ncbi:MAG TPA: ATP-binding protein [Bacteriovoracaceae bacterium]|nr:ATP-binding protein [Bacteriovoracaceae bacterium]
METNQILLIFFILLSAGLALALYLSKRRARQLTKQLDELNAHTEEDMYGRGKLSELGLMSAGITHEISNPLSIIMGRLELLMKNDRQLEKESLKKGLEQIKVNSERIATIVQSVRSYIYRDEDKVEDFISLKEIIDSVLVFCGQRLQSHGIELKLRNIDKIYVSGHRGQYEQAILNLINNAFDAVDHLPEKWIEISATRSFDVVMIFFVDSGHGIPVEVSAKMLDPFYSTKKGRGTGLGLTLVKGIAQKHGGDLKYAPEEPHTTFMLELPQASAMKYQQYN